VKFSPIPGSQADLFITEDLARIERLTDTLFLRGASAKKKDEKKNSDSLPRELFSLLRRGFVIPPFSPGSQIDSQEDQTTSGDRP